MTSIKVVLSTVADGSMYNRHNDADPAVISNRRSFLEAHHFPFSRTTRVDTQLLRRATVEAETDYCRFVTVAENEAGDGIDGAATIVADALITTTPNLPLMLPVADCVGAVLFDASKSILMVSHLGRHSLEQQGAQRSVEHLQASFGCDPKDLEIWLTPASGKASYQICALDNQGMKEAALGQLQAAGVPLERIHDDKRDTALDLDFYSYSEFLKGNRKEDGDHMIAAVMTTQ